VQVNVGLPRIYRPTGMTFSGNDVGRSTHQQLAMTSLFHRDNQFYVHFSDLQHWPNIYCSERSQQDQANEIQAHVDRHGFKNFFIVHQPSASGPSQRGSCCTQQETVDATHRLSNGKFPGTVSIPSDIYKAWCPCLVDVLTDLFMECVFRNVPLKSSKMYQ